MKTIITYFFILFVGITIGAVGMYMLMGDNDARDVTGEVAVRQVSGAKIEQRDVRADNRSITMRTIAEGKGEAVTEIPANVVPAAREWLESNNVVQPLIGYEYGSGGSHSFFGAMYLRRKGRFAAGGGILGSSEKIGILASFQYTF